ncbi:hypothetical protein NIE88_17205 [Sporolactobacillus shoreicorticis]|uniref:Uncharacterized protein n=1 Tax=Sporolactobacillus shoreicorticis TaxID=1923877 RepID=A0ABW5S157_9BACL|nr:hypothetical protein [Sporolactobacillus shoreicorticis]MCO7127498.1 hypothetical protein [Sporolactobacillus shoreicorticis]
MKKIILFLLIVLIVIGGVFFIGHLNQNASKDQASSKTNLSTQSQEKKSENKPISSSSSVTSSVKNQRQSSRKPNESEANVRSDLSAQPNESEMGHSSSTANTSTNDTGSLNKANDSSTKTGIDNQTVSRPKGAWVQKFEKDLYNGYHVTPSRYKFIGNGRWEVWVKEQDTGQNPYVTVNQYTGDFHG